MKRVLVVHGACVLMAGIGSLLSRQEDLIVTIISTPDGQAMRQEIERVRPNVIVCDESLALPVWRMLIKMLGSFPEIRLIAVDSHDNCLHIYERLDTRKNVVNHSGDLLSAVRN